MSRKQSFASNSSSEVSHEDVRRFDEHEIEDSIEIDSNKAVSLFDNFTSSSSHDVWVYMKKVFGFDLTEIQRNIKGFDDFKRITLTNYLRRQQKMGHKVLGLGTSKTLVAEIVSSVDVWNIEENLIPVMSDDRLLWELPADYEDQETNDAEGNDEKMNEEDLKGEVSFLRGELNRVKELLHEVLESKEESHDGKKAKDFDELGELNGAKDLDGVEDEVKGKQSRSRPVTSADRHNDDRSVARFLDEDKYYFESYSNLTIHREMILDAPRTSAYSDFINAASGMFEIVNNCNNYLSVLTIISFQII